MRFCSNMECKRVLLNIWAENKNICKESLDILKFAESEKYSDFHGSGLKKLVVRNRLLSLKTNKEKVL